MHANIVSPPRAGTSFAHSTVAIGGSARNVSSECQMSVPKGGVVSSLRNLMSTGAVPSFGARYDAVSATQLPAELLLINPAGVAVTEMKP